MQELLKRIYDDPITTMQDNPCAPTGRSRLPRRNAPKLAKADGAHEGSIETQRQSVEALQGERADTTYRDARYSPIFHLQGNDDGDRRET